MMNEKMQEQVSKISDEIKNLDLVQIYCQCGKVWKIKEQAIENSMRSLLDDCDALKSELIAARDALDCIRKEHDCSNCNSCGACGFGVNVFKSYAEEALSRIDKFLGENE